MDHKIQHFGWHRPGGSSYTVQAQVPRLLRGITGTLREYWRWRKPKLYLFPGGAAKRGKDTPVTGKGVWHACREVLRRAVIQKKVGPNLLGGPFRGQMSCDAPQSRREPAQYLELFFMAPERSSLQ